MVYENKYSKKEILVFEGFIKLIDEGVSLSSIKVADIAKSAGIGKGTVYEYFKNKEEVIAKSILYKMHKEFVNMIIKIESVEGFKNKCDVGFQEILEIMTSRCAYFQMLMTSREIHDVFKCINHGKDEMIEFRDYVVEILEPIIELGIKEGVINCKLDKIYIRSVFVSVCSGISTISRFQFGQFTQSDLIIQKDIAYTILIKALN